MIISHYWTLPQWIPGTFLNKILLTRDATCCFTWLENFHWDISLLLPDSFIEKCEMCITYWGEYFLGWPSLFPRQQYPIISSLPHATWQSFWRHSKSQQCDNALALLINSPIWRLLELENEVIAVYLASFEVTICYFCRHVLLVACLRFLNVL